MHMVCWMGVRAGTQDRFLAAVLDEKRCSCTSIWLVRTAISSQAYTAQSLQLGRLGSLRIETSYHVLVHQIEIEVVEEVHLVKKRNFPFS